jgi:glycosyltransferase involved in cell wall biosynthesis
MNLIFVSSDLYPDGGAATNRHMAYAKGLVETGHRVTFVLLSNQNSIHHGFSDEGTIYIFAFPEGYDYKNSNKFKKLFSQIKSIKAGILIISQIHRKAKIDAIVLLDTFVGVLIPFIWLAKTNGIRVLHERTEYPHVVAGKKLIERINLYIYFSFILRRFDGIYVISQALKNYFNQCLNYKIPIEIINMIVDPARFKVVDTLPIDTFKYIAYCGTLNSEKDGVDILVEAFEDTLLSGKIPNDIKLLLIGDYIDEAFRTKLNKIIEDNKYINNIIFTGKVERRKIPDLLNRASALVLARPNNKQSEGGFPTKLGEYLSTGKPVIITEVGEISHFLKDGYNAYIAKPGDVESFSEKIYEVFADYPRALEIGKNGRMLVENEFNYFNQAKKLASFIESL